MESSQTKILLLDSSKFSKICPRLSPTSPILTSSYG